MRFKPDARLIAAETPIVELGGPLLEVDTWLGYRRYLLDDWSMNDGVSGLRPMKEIEVGGENCFDMAWCHYAKTNLTGKQFNGEIKNVTYHENSPALLPTDDSADTKRRSCVVLYQTPIVHIDKKSRGRGIPDEDKICFDNLQTKSRVCRNRQDIASRALCKYFKLKLQTLDTIGKKSGLGTVYELFNV